MNPFALACLLLPMVLCGGGRADEAMMNASAQPWGTTKDGESVTLFTLQNAGIEAQITNFGGIIVQLKVPDRDGKVADIVLGKASLAEYEAGHPFFGPITGRYANRIAHGTFSIDGQSFQVAKRAGAKHAIHGGIEGFDKKVWAAEVVTVPNEAVGVVMRYTSADGEEGFPGELQCVVRYTLTKAATLRIDYEATSSKPTVVNLTNHSYFNLGGHHSGAVTEHLLTLHADRYTVTDEDLIPTGEIAPLSGTPLDFAQPTRIGSRIDEQFEALRFGAGYDHNYVLSATGSGLKPCARVEEPSSGRVMEVETTCPAVQLYTANHMKEVAGKDGAVYRKRAGFCLETQHYPDSPNQPSFPTTLLRPGESYRQSTTFRFTVAQDG
jgi:aldose 1-epimerase